MHVSETTNEMAVAGLEEVAAAEAACRVYVGNLLPKAKETHLQAAFARFGVIHNVWIARKPPGFAFVRFASPAAAQRAVEGCRDATLEILGKPVRVQMAGEKAKKPVPVGVEQHGTASAPGDKEARSARRSKNRSHSSSRSPSRHRRRYQRSLDRPEYTHRGAVARSRSRSERRTRDRDSRRSSARHETRRRAHSRSRTRSRSRLRKSSRSRTRSRSRSRSRKGHRSQTRSRSRSASVSRSRHSHRRTSRSCSSNQGQRASRRRQHGRSGSPIASFSPENRSRRHRR